MTHLSCPQLTETFQSADFNLAWKFYFLLLKVLVSQLCLTLCDPMDLFSIYLICLQSLPSGFRKSFCVHCSLYILILFLKLSLFFIGLVSLSLF